MKVNSPQPPETVDLFQAVFPVIPSEISYLVELTRLSEFSPKNAKTFPYVSCILLLSICVWLTRGLLLGVEWQGSHLEGAFSWSHTELDHEQHRMTWRRLRS